MASLTTSGFSCLERTLDVDFNTQDSDDFKNNYEILRCVSWIQEGNFKKVCLQFPDELLADSASVAHSLTKNLGFKVFILGDTTYGSCCVDEVAAEHIGADAVVHFGRTCLSSSGRLPVLYIFTRIHVEVSSVVSKLTSAIEDPLSRLIFLYDVRCHHISDAVARTLKKTFPKLVISELLPHSYDTGIFSENAASESDNYQETCDGSTCTNLNSSDLKSDNVVHFSGRVVVLENGTDIKDYQFIYLGQDGPALTTMLMRFSENSFYCVNPVDGTVKLTSGVQSVMSRSGKLEMAKDADIIGILVGTLGVSNYRDIIARLKCIIRNAGKRSYTFAVGKPNEPKLANIAEVDVFVYVSCRETATIDRHTDPALYKKLITPWELEVALLPEQEWSLKFECDFRQLLSGGTRHVEMNNIPQEEQVDVSLLSSKTQRRGISDVQGEPWDSTTGAVVLQSGLAVSKIHVGGAGEILKNRTWQGLDVSVPATTPVGVVVEGRRGIATVYEDENNSNTDTY